MSHDGGITAPLKNRSKEKRRTDQGKMSVAARGEGQFPKGVRCQGFNRLRQIQYVAV